VRPQFAAGKLRGSLCLGDNKILPQKPEARLLADILEEITRLGTIHLLFHPSVFP
jgi:hypothetical protein